jgi:hypothetical protein
VIVLRSLSPLVEGECVGWLAAVDYRRGPPEDGRPKPCRGYGKVKNLADDVIIGALADGAPAASLAHIGAKNAVCSAITTLENDMARVVPAIARESRSGAFRLFEDLLNAVYADLRAEASRRSAAIEDLASTLIVFAAGPHGLVAMQVGGGLVVCRARDAAYDLLLAGAANGRDGRTGNTTTGGGARNMQVSVKAQAIEFLCAATGALQPVSLRSKDGTPREPFFRSLDHYAASAIDDRQIHRGIREFLRSRRLSRNVKRDMTMAVCRYSARDGAQIAAE